MDHAGEALHPQADLEPGNADIDALDQLVTDGVTSLVTNSLTFFGAIVFLLILDWRLALATLAVMPFLIAATLWFRSRSARA